MDAGPAGKCLPCWGRGCRPGKRGGGGQKPWGPGSCPKSGLSRTWSPGADSSTGPKYPSDQMTLLGIPSLAPAFLQASLSLGLSGTRIPLGVGDGGGLDCHSSSLQPPGSPFQEQNWPALPCLEPCSGSWLSSVSSLAPKAFVIWVLPTGQASVSLLPCAPPSAARSQSLQFLKCGHVSPPGLLGLRSVVSSEASVLSTPLSRSVPLS